MQRFIPTGLRGQLVALVLLGLIPLLALQGWGIYRGYQDRIDAELRSEGEMASAIGRAFVNYLGSVWSTESALGAGVVRLGVDGDPAQVRTLLDGEVPVDTPVRAWAWLDSRGLIVAATDLHLEGLDRSQDPHIVPLLSGAAMRTTSDLVEDPTGHLTLEIASAVRRDGRLVGVVVACVRVADLGAVLRVDRGGDASYGVVDRQGYIVYRSTAPNLSRAERQVAAGGPVRAALQGRFAVNPHFTGMDQVVRMGAALPIPEVGWVAYASVPVAQVLGMSMQQARQDSAWLLLVAVLSVVTALLFGRWLLRPVARLQAAALAISAGDLTARAGMAGANELAQATQAFDRMADRVQAAERERDRFFALSEDMLAIGSLHGPGLRVNPAWSRMLGLPPEEFGALQLRELVHPVDWLLAVDALRRLRHGESIEMELRVRLPAGHYGWFASTAVPDLDTDRLYSVTRDITDRKIMEEAQQQRAQQQAAVAALGLRALAGVDEHDLMQEATHMVAETLGVQCVAVNRRQADTGQLTVVAGVGWRDGVVGTHVIPGGLKSLAGYTAEMQEAVLVRYLPGETRFEVPPILLEHGLVSGISVNIGHGMSYGTMGAYATQERAFSPDDMNFLQAVGNVLGTVITRHGLEQERVDLLEREQAARAAAEALQQREAFLVQMTTQLASSLDYGTTLQRLAELTVPMLGDWCTVYGLEEGSGQALPLGFAHNHPPGAERLARYQQTSRISQHYPEAIGRALATGHSLLVPEVSERGLAQVAQDPEHLELLRAWGGISLIVVPLIAHGRQYGILLYLAAAPRRHGPEDLALAEEVAQRAVLALENARLYREAQEAVRLLRLSEALLIAQKLVLEQIMSDATLIQLFKVIGRFVEEQAPPGIATIYLVHPNGMHLQHQPTAREADDAVGEWVAIEPTSGSTAEAVLRREPVFTADLETDPIWPPVYRAQAGAHGLRAAWAVPILSSAGLVLGALTVYYRDAYQPTEQDWHVVTVASQLAGVAIERKRAEQAQGEKLRALIANMSEGVVAMDEQRHILVINPAADVLLAVDSPAAGRRVGQAGLPPALTAALELAASDGPLSHRVTFELGGRHIDAHISAVVADDRRYGALALLTNVTGEVQLRRLQESFVANFSHELRGPLATLGAVIQALYDRLIPPESRQRYEQALLDEIDRLHRLTDAMLDMARLDAGVMRMAQEALDLAPLCQGVAAKLAARCQASGLDLQVDCPGLLVHGDRDRVEQVVLNLLDNAIRFTPPGGTVRLRAEVKDQMAVVSISDTGIGIDRQHLPFVWERFYKVDEARTRKPGSGSGLGLAIVKDLVTRLGGQVAVESKLGHGTTFRFTLSLARA